MAVAAGNALSRASRAAGLGSGSVVGGHAVLAVDPRALAHLALGRQVMLVSGTNGKTTTTKLLARAATAATGTEVVTNLQGANLTTGLAAALASGPLGAPAVLEVDEAWLGHVLPELRPAVLVLLNLSRDQLDRNNEVRHVAQRWRDACQRLEAGAVVVANADDPLVDWAALAAPSVVWVGAGLGWKNDATGCPACAGPVSFGDGGDWKCDGCSLARPGLDMWLEGEGREACAVAGDRLGGPARYTLGLALPGRCNEANAATVLAAVLASGWAGGPAVVAMRQVDEVAGRYARAEHAGTRARLLLAKNPAGWAEVFDMVGASGGPVVVAINARTADGHDPSWLWDVPFERLAGRRVVATGERCLDLSVRLHYAGVEHAVERGLLAALAVAGPGDADVVANYTALHQLLAVLPARGQGTRGRGRGTRGAR